MMRQPLWAKRQVMTQISNVAARRIFLARHGLAGPRPETLLQEIELLGFVQIDSIDTVARAQHMILAARRKSYRQPQLATALERKRDLFEHWTHDAAAIPTEYFPYWRLRFERDKARLAERWRRWRKAGFEDEINRVLTRVRDHGPTMARELEDAVATPPREAGSAGWWDWRPSKTALEYLWRTGVLAVSGRRGFQKAFDLTERVIPAAALAFTPTEAETIHWAGASALDRLGFATSGEIAAFWATITPAEAKAWAASRLGDDVVEIKVVSADGRVRTVLARPGLVDEAKAAPPASSAIRVLSPFDPVLRDRKRAEWLFGFDYRIEIFVPAAKRRYGYYVFPLLEGETLIGRIDMKRNGPGGPLEIRACWLEPGVKPARGRIERLERELVRVARYAKADGVTFLNGWLQDQQPAPRG